MTGWEAISLTELPLGLQGRIFRSPMPFGDFDPQGSALNDFKKQEVSVVVVLSGDEECVRKARRDLRTLYALEGFNVIHVPILDFAAPAKVRLESTLTTTIEHAQAGRHVAIHCHAGIGRTGMFAACLARRVLGLSGRQAIEWVRRLIPGAVETTEQEQFVLGD